MFTINKGNLEKYTGTQEHVTVPDEVTVISDYGFYGAKNMKTITIPDTVKEIGNNAFYDCEELEEIVLPDSVSYIGSGLFIRCKNLKKVTLSNRLFTLPKITFFQCENLEEVILPKYLKKLNRACFEQCHSLQKILLPDSLTVIEEKAFDDCMALKEITLPEGLQEIGDNAFFNCSGLRKINIPSSLKKMGKGALETRGKISVTSETFPIRSQYLDNNWNLNWNFGANGRYNGKNEENYQLFNSYLPHVNLKEYKPQAQCILCINYLETYREDLSFYNEWIHDHVTELLSMIVDQRRYKALETGVEKGCIDTQEVEPYLERIHDPEIKAFLLSKNETNDLDDLFDLL